MRLSILLVTSAVKLIATWIISTDKGVNDGVHLSLLARFFFFLACVSDESKISDVVYKSTLPDHLGVVTTIDTILKLPFFNYKG